MSKDRVTETSSLEVVSYEATMKPYLPKEFRHFLEKNFYARVGEQSKLAALKKDASFLKNPMKHVGLFTDHSVVHVRDVALRSLILIDKVNGTLIPQRQEKDLAFIKAYSLQLVYLHDIGMSVFSDFGRFMHPEFAAQFVFEPEFNVFVDLLWQKNIGDIPNMLQSIFKNKSEEKLKNIHRELLVFSVAHSKSKVPINIVNNPEKFRNLLLNILSKPLELLFFEQKIERLERKLKKADVTTKKIKLLKKKLETFKKKRKQFLNANSKVNMLFLDKYEDYKIEAFSWLLEKDKKVQRLIINILDSVRCIRAADALRQRGTVLRTSAGYEIFIDKKTANAVYALRDESSNALFLLQSNKSINAGEANLESSYLDSYGNLRASFHVGSFHNKRIAKKAAKTAAITIDDIQQDIIQSFDRDSTLDSECFSKPIVTSEKIKILLENTNDNPNFVPLVCKALEELNPKIAYRIKNTLSFKGYSPEELERYFEGIPLSQMLKRKKFKEEFFKNIVDKEICVVKNGTIAGEKHVHIITLKAGEQLIKGNSNSSFVYYPISNGLTVYPLGGYNAIPTAAWVPLGNSGVIRGSIRNADVLADKEVTLICIPKDIYMKYWYTPLTAKELFNKW